MSRHVLRKHFWETSTACIGAIRPPPAAAQDTSPSKRAVESLMTPFILIAALFSIASHSCDPTKSYSPRYGRRSPLTPASCQLQSLRFNDRYPCRKRRARFEPRGSRSPDPLAGAGPPARPLLGSVATPCAVPEIGYRLDPRRRVPRDGGSRDTRQLGSICSVGAIPARPKRGSVGQSATWGLLQSPGQGNARRRECVPWDARSSPPYRPCRGFRTL